MANQETHRYRAALITGATRGIGRAIAEQLASQGLDLLLVARSERDLASLQLHLREQYPNQHFQIFVADLSQVEEIRRVGDWAQEHAPDVLVSNAAVFKPVSLLNEVEDDFLPQFYLNYYATHELSIRLARQMKKTGHGHLIMIGSTASRQPVKAGAYTVTKYAVKGLTLVLREELRAFGVKVTEIVPGSTRTSSWDGTTYEDERFVKPEEIAKAVALCLAMSDQTNVEEIVIKPQLGNILTDC